MQVGSVQFSEAQLQQVRAYVTKLSKEHEEKLEAYREELASAKQELRDEKMARKLLELELLREKMAEGGFGEQDNAVKKWLEDYRASASASGPALPNPLHWAARMGQLRIVQFFVQSKADLNALDEDGDAPLHLAVENGHADVVQCLVDGGARLDMCRGAGGKNQPVLHVAAARGSAEIVSALLAAGADVNAVATWEKDHATALHIAVENGHVGVVQCLAWAGAGLDIPRKSIGRAWPALHVAALKGFVGVVDALLAAGADVNAASLKGETALHLASSADVVKALLRAPNVNVDAAQCTYDPRREPVVTPLHLALEARPRRWRIVQLLLEAGASITAEGGTRAAMEAIVEDVELVQLMLKKGAADVAQLGLCLCAAAEKKSFTAVDALLRAGVRGDASRHVYERRTEKDESALYFAIASKDVVMVKRLLAAGANPNAVRTYKYGVRGNRHYQFNTEPALCTAVRAHSLAIVKMLVAYGADVHKSDFCDKRTDPPTKVAVWEEAKNQPEILQYFKNLGLCVNQTQCKDSGIWGFFTGAMPQEFCR